MCSFKLLNVMWVYFYIKDAFITATAIDDYAENHITGNQDVDTMMASHEESENPGISSYLYVCINIYRLYIN